LFGAPPLNLDAHGVGAGHGPRLLDGEAHGAGTELVEGDGRELLAQGLDELVGGPTGVLAEGPGHSRVVQRIRDVVGGGGGPVAGLQPDVDPDLLPLDPLVGVDPDEGPGPEVADLDDIRRPAVPPAEGDEVSRGEAWSMARG
jgi:hypothetical protein